MIRVPTVETERLILRAPRLSDFGHMAAFFRSPHSKLVGGPKSRIQTLWTLFAMRAHWWIHGHGYWQIKLKPSGQPIGATGIAKFAGADEPELGLFIYKGFESKGYGFEAAEAARVYTARHLGVDNVAAFMNPKNTRAISHVKSLGGTFEREATVLGRRCHIYRFPSETEAQDAAQSGNDQRQQDWRST